MESAANRRLIAVVDSNRRHRTELNAALTSFYDICDFSDGRSAQKALKDAPPAVIVFGEEVEPTNCINFVKELRAIPALRFTPLLHIINSKNMRLIDQSRETGACDILTKPYRRSDLIGEISTMLNAGVEDAWENLPEMQRQALQNSIGVFNNIADALMTGESVAFNSVKDNCQPLVAAVENNDFKSILDGVRDHDDYTYAHSMRVATMLTLLGHAAGFKNDDQLLLSSGGLLHDVGKMNIPHHILNKPGRLNDDEFDIMKSHVTGTVDYLKKVDDIPKAVFIIAEQHHEKIDGTGYPYGLKGKELNELSRMAAIVDVFSALTDRRVYKEPMEASKAVHIMSEEMSGHLDQHYVKMFKTILVDAKLLI